MVMRVDVDCELVDAVSERLAKGGEEKTARAEVF